MDVLVIVDMQNDFIDGSLANPEAQEIVEPICELIMSKKWNDIVLTMDTHQKNYLKTQEGRRLPVEHCIEGTDGWKLNEEIEFTCNNRFMLKHMVYPHGPLHKNSFGYIYWKMFKYDLRKLGDTLNIYIVGTCTDICVISNALILKSTYPEANITVYSNLCAGTTKENHEAALRVMKSCQIDVEEWHD